MAYGSQGGGGFEGSTARTAFSETDHPLPKKLMVIDPTIFTSSAPNQTRAPGGDALIEFVPANLDLFRYRAGAFWNGTGEINKFTFWAEPQALTSSVIPVPISDTSNIPQFKVVGHEEAVRMNDVNEPLAEFKEKIVIESIPDILDQALTTGGTAQTSGLWRRQKWLKMLDTGKTNWNPAGIKIEAMGPHLRVDSKPKEFYDHVCEIETPLDKREVGDNFYGSVRTLIASVDPVYNFYISPYEGIMKENTGYNVPEQLLPNLYSFLTVLQSEDDVAVDTIFEKQVTLNNTLTDAFATKEVLNNSGEKVQTKVTKGQYFEKYSYGYIKYNEGGPSQTEKQELLDRFTNLVVPMSNLNLFVDYNNKALQFPMYCDISFSTDVSTKVADTLKKSKLCSVFLKDVMEDQISGFKKPNLPFNFYPIENLPFAPDNASGVDESESLSNWDITAWIQNLINNPVESYSNMTKGVFLGKYDEEITMASGEPSYNFFKNLMVIVFSGKFKKLVETKTRSYKDILQGKKAYHETAFYKIEKWAANSEGVPTTHLQNYYLPNSSDIDTHKIIDTQVKYNKKYVYRIYAYEFIFGTKYSYTFDEIPKQYGRPPNGFTINNTQAKLCVIWTPSVKMIEVPYYQTGPIVVMDSPPVWPNVNIVPYRSIKNKLLFMFEGNVGNYKLQPILLQPNDQTIIDQIRESQRLASGDPITFKSDDQANRFEIFKITKRPTSYDDFKNSVPIEVETDLFATPCKFANSATYVDTIIPNTKYYYTFRVLDNHGHFSNPSAVYEVEIIYDAGSPFLQMRTIEFEKVKEPVQIPSKSFRKYVRIRPAISQREINYEKSGLIRGAIPPVQIDPESDGKFIQFGYEDETAWGKRFKVRLISKKTGKKIDINLDMTTEHLKSKNDTNNNLC